MKEALPFILAFLFILILFVVIWIELFCEKRIPRASKLPPPPEPKRYPEKYVIREVISNVRGEILYAPALQTTYGAVVFFDIDTADKLRKITGLEADTCVFYDRPNIVKRMLVFGKDPNTFICFRNKADAKTYIEKVERFEARSYFNSLNEIEA